MGDLLRRFWIPVAGSAEVRSGRARPVRVLGEDLACSARPRRARAGRRPLPHRGASLAYGFADDRCLPLSLPRLGVRADGQCPEPPTLAGAPALRAPCAHPGLSGAGPRRSRVRVPLPGSAPVVSRASTSSCSVRCLRDIGRPSSRATGCRSWRTASTRCTSSGCTGYTCRVSVSAAGSPRPREYERPSTPRSGSTCSSYGIVKRRVLEDELAGRRRLARSGIRLCSRTRPRVGAGASIGSRSGSRSTTPTRCTGGTRAISRRRSVSAVEQDEIPVYDVPFRDEHGVHPRLRRRWRHL